MPFELGIGVAFTPSPRLFLEGGSGLQVTVPINRAAGPIRLQQLYLELAGGSRVPREKDGDVAYVGSDWQEGIRPWEFGNYTDLTQADPMLRGSVFTDRGVYKLGEEIHLKAILRHDTANGIKLLPEGTPSKSA